MNITHINNNKKSVFAFSIIASALLAVAPSPQLAHAAGGTVVTPPFEAVGVQAEEAQAIEVLFRRAYARETRRPVVAAPPDAVGQPLPDLCAAASCNLLLTGSVTRLGSRIVVAVDEVDPQGRIIHSVQATANSMDDLETVLPRLAAALAAHLPYSETKKAENVSMRETLAPNKVRSVTVPILRAGPLFARLDGGMATGVEGAADVRWERGDFFVGFAIGLAIPASEGDQERYGGLFAELGGGYYFLEGDFSPYVSGYFVPKLVGASGADPDPDDFDDDGGAGVGFGLGAKVGLMLFRSQNTRFIVEGGIEQDIIEIGGHAPTLFRLGFGVGI